MEKRPFDFCYKLLDNKYTSSQEGDFALNPSLSVEEDDYGRIYVISFEEYLNNMAIEELKLELDRLDIEILSLKSIKEQNVFINTVLKSIKYLLGQFNKPQFKDKYQIVIGNLNKIRDEITDKYEMNDDNNQESSNLNLEEETNTNDIRFIWGGQLNTLCHLLYNISALKVEDAKGKGQEPEQKYNYIKSHGKNLKSDLAEFIFRHFTDRKGNQFDKATIKRNLTDTKPPAEKNKIILEDVIPPQNKQEEDSSN
jgi:hypothetical protein